MLPDVLSINDGDNPIELQLVLHLIINKEGLSNRTGISHTCSLDQDVVKFVLAFHQIAQDTDQITAHGAANAAIVHLKDFFFGSNDQILVNTNLPKLILNHGDPFAM